MPDRSLLGLFDLPKAAPLKIGMREDVRASVQRCQDKLPVLGQRNPDAVSVIERNIDDLLPSSFHGIDPDQTVPPRLSLVDMSARVNIGALAPASVPRVDEDLTSEAPPLWWWTDPTWIERETALVNVLLAIKRYRPRTRGFRKPLYWQQRHA